MPASRQDGIGVEVQIKATFLLPRSSSIKPLRIRHIFHRSQPSQPSAVDACVAEFKASIPHSTTVSVTSYDSATRNLITTFDPDNRHEEGLGFSPQ
ncbi:hypothetical protein M407DRAFT_247101, partial [Tulasnella calospora MUT 4182]